MMVVGRSPKGVDELPLSAEDIDQLRRGFRAKPSSELSIVQDPALLGRQKVNAAFQILADGTGRIILGDNPSWYEYLHEFLHYKHWKEGKDAYAALTNGQKELYVFDKLVSNRGAQPGASYWSRLTVEERAHAIANMEQQWAKHPRQFSADDVTKMKGALQEAKRRLNDPVQ